MIAVLTVTSIPRPVAARAHAMALAKQSRPRSASFVAGVAPSIEIWSLTRSSSRTLGEPLAGEEHPVREHDRLSAVRDGRREDLDQVAAEERLAAR